MHHFYITLLILWCFVATDASDLWDPFSKLQEVLNTPFVFVNSSDAECRQQSQMYLRDLENLRPWAMHMRDSSAKLPSGLLQGNVVQYGDYEQCVGLAKGRYCLTTIHVSFLPQSDNEKNRQISDILDRVQSHNLIKSDLEQFTLPVPQPDLFIWASCLPSSCSHIDLKLELEKRAKLIKDQLPGLNIRLRVNERDCETERNQPLTSTAIAASMLIFIPFAVSILSWILEPQLLSRQNKSLKILLCFSLGRNYHRLFDCTPDKGRLRCVHGLRVIFAILVFVAHKAGLFSLLPVSNRVDLTSLLEQKWTLIVRTFWIYLDTFFFISALLTSFFAMEHLKNGRKLNILKMYIRRYYKFTGMTIVIGVLYGYVFPELMKGPLALQFLREHSLLCRGKVWTLATYTANLFGIQNMCLVPANHLITDTHLYLIAPWLILALWKRPRLSVILILTTCVLVSVLKYYVLKSNNLSPVIYHGITFQEMVFVVDKLLFSSIFRLPPYLAGIVVGTALQSIPDSMYIPKPLLWLGHTLALAITYFGVTGPLMAYERGYQFHVEDTLMYGVLQPVVWPLALAWIIFLCATGNADGLNRLLSKPVFIIGSRLMYAFNLVQIPIILFFLHQARVHIHASAFTLIDLPEFLVILAVCVFFSLLYLMPLGELWSVLTTSSTEKKAPNASITKNKSSEKQF